MSDLNQELEETVDGALAAVAAAGDVDALDSLKTEHLGRKGTLTGMLRNA